MNSTLPFPAWPLFLRRADQELVGCSGPHGACCKSALRCFQFVCWQAMLQPTPPRQEASLEATERKRTLPDFQPAELRRFMESAPIFPNNSWYKLTANIDASDTSTVPDQPDRPFLAGCPLMPRCWMALILPVSEIQNLVHQSTNDRQRRLL